MSFPLATFQYSRIFNQQLELNGENVTWLSEWVMMDHLSRQTLLVCSVIPDDIHVMTWCVANQQPPTIDYCLLYMTCCVANQQPPTIDYCLLYMTWCVANQLPPTIDYYLLYSQSSKLNHQNWRIRFSLWTIEWGIFDWCGTVRTSGSADWMCTAANVFEVFQSCWETPALSTENEMIMKYCFRPLGTLWVKLTMKQLPLSGFEPATQWSEVQLDNLWTTAPAHLLYPQKVYDKYRRPCEDQRVFRQIRRYMYVLNRGVTEVWARVPYPGSSPSITNFYSGCWVYLSFLSVWWHSADISTCSAKGCTMKM